MIMEEINCISIKCRHLLVGLQKKLMRPPPPTGSLRRTNATLTHSVWFGKCVGVVLSN
jgi:hypothetical protein